MPRTNVNAGVTRNRNSTRSRKILHVSHTSAFRILGSLSSRFATSTSQSGLRIPLIDDDDDLVAHAIESLDLWSRASAWSWGIQWDVNARNSVRCSLLGFARMCFAWAFCFCVSRFLRDWAEGIFAFSCALSFWNPAFQLFWCLSLQGGLASLFLNFQMYFVIRTQ